MSQQLLNPPKPPTLHETEVQRVRRECGRILKEMEADK